MSIKFQENPQNVHCHFRNVWIVLYCMLIKQQIKYHYQLNLKTTYTR